jgi:hypothetical protein
MVYRRSKNVSDMSQPRGYEQAGSDSNLGQPVWVLFPWSPVPQQPTQLASLSLYGSQKKKLEHDQQVVFNEEQYIVCFNLRHPVVSIHSTKQTVCSVQNTTIVGDIDKKLY